MREHFGLRSCCRRFRGVCGSDQSEGNHICVYEVAKLLIESGGAFQSLNLLKLSGLGKQAVFYVGMGFGVYGMALLCSHISAYHTVAKIRVRLIRHLGELPLGYHMQHPSGVQRKVIEKNTDNLEILIAHHIPVMCSRQFCRSRFSCSCSGMTGGCL